RTPNLSPKGTTTVWDDDHLLFADIRSPQTLRNLREKPVAEINVVDPIVRKGYRFKGQATLHSDDVYERGLALLAERGYDARPERVRTIVLVKIEQAAPLVSPAYDSGATEEAVAARWERHLAEILRPRSELRDPALAAAPVLKQSLKSWAAGQAPRRFRSSRPAAHATPFDRVRPIAPLATSKSRSSLRSSVPSVPRGRRRRVRHGRAPLWRGFSLHKVRNRAAPESNRPSVGAPRRPGFKV